MADPFSIATGVLGLVGTAATVVKFLDTVKSTVQDVPRNIAWTLAEINDVHSAVARLHSLFEHIESVPNAARALIAIQDAAVAVAELVNSFDQLVELLKPFGMLNLALLKAWDKMKWILKQDDIARAVMRIQTRKGSLTLMLNILQCESDVVAVESRAALQNGINTLIEGDTAIQKRLERMERRWISQFGDIFDNHSIQSAGAATVQASQPLPKPDSSPATGSAPPLLETEEEVEGASGLLPFRLEFEEALEESGVYRRVHRPFDTFSIMSGEGRSIARTVMTTYSLAENASILTSFPILDRTELRHPEFYVSSSVESDPRRRFLGIGAARNRSSSESNSVSSRLSIPGFKSQEPPNLGPNVMGEWHVTVRRTWRARQFRFEVLFEVPVFFVAPPTNTRGPVRGAPIVYLDGSLQSIRASRSQPAVLQHRMDRPVALGSDNERASWVALLSAVQDMERRSREWNDERRRLDSGHNASIVRIQYGITVAIQSKTRSWDAVPPGVRKPYAVTAMTHLVEISALLGIYWLQFDRINDRYFAEGGGFVLKGTPVPGLGITFEFQLSGVGLQPVNRLIPTEDVKFLCFGRVPTIFRHEFDELRLPEDQPGRLEYLDVSSRKDIARTLVKVGCNASTIDYMLNGGQRDSHIFPVVFELIGMLCPILHIEGTAFRRLPNPTNYVWEGDSIPFWSLLSSYETSLTNARSQGKFTSLSSTEDSIYQGLPDLIAEVKFITKGHELGAMASINWNEGFILLHLLHKALEDVDADLLVSDDQNTSQERHILVQTIVRAHIQEVLRGMNEKPTDDVNQRTMTAEPRFEDIYKSSSPDEKYKIWMDVYFQSVRPKVLAEVIKSFPLLAEECERIWYLLVFRMLCWLMLHDFDRRDVQISDTKSALLGSRLPVYIV